MSTTTKKPPGIRCSTDCGRYTRHKSGTCEACRRFLAGKEPKREDTGKIAIRGRWECSPARHAIHEAGIVPPGKGPVVDHDVRTWCGVYMRTTFNRVSSPADSTCCKACVRKLRIKTQ